MESDSFFIYFSSEDSKVFFPDNQASSFKLNLPERLFLKGKWGCSLSDIAYNLKGKLPKEDCFFFCLDICETSITGDSKWPVLRQVPLSKLRKKISYSHRNYIPVILKELSVLHVYLINRSGNILSLDGGVLSCSLHFKRHLLHGPL